MMPCDQCHEREAVIQLTQIVNEQVSTLHLCERCAAERGVESAGMLSKTPLGSFLAAMGKGEPAGAEQIAAAVPGTCPECGATLEDFRETGRLGCGACYEAFESPLRELLRRLHGSTYHAGERYAPPGAATGDAGARQDALRGQLRLAIETENFELAAELRDQLRVLE